MSEARAASTLRRDLWASTVDGCAVALMVGVGETYLPAFALAYGLSEISAGLVATAPMLAGAVVQLVAPAAVLRLRSYRRWIVGAALVQRPCSCCSPGSSPAKT